MAKCIARGTAVKRHPFLPALIIILTLLTLVSVSGCSNRSANELISSAAQTESSEEPMQKKQPITYTPYNVSELMQDLESNSLKAKDKYNDQYVELTGKLNNIDSNGSYIDLVPENDEYALIGIQCYLTEDDQKDTVMNLKIGDTVTLRGQITDVGEIMGYSLDIAEFVPS